MDTNPVIEMLGRRLRLAVIGGGPGSFIGAMHRTAARLDDRYEIVAGALSSDPDRSRAAAASIGIDADRAYPNAIELLDAEATRADGADVVADHDPQRQPSRVRARRARPGVRRHLRQADHEHARRGARRGGPVEATGWSSA